MLEYLLKRLLWFIPTLFLVTLLGFTLLVYAPGDPMDLLVDPMATKSNGSGVQEQKDYWRKQLGLDLPVFYFSVNRWSEPDTLYKIRDQQKLKTYRELLRRSGNAEAVDQYFKAVSECLNRYDRLAEQSASNDTNSTSYRNRAGLLIAGASLKALEGTADTVQQRYHLNAVKKNLRAFSENLPDLTHPITESMNALRLHKTLYKNFIPKISWYGSHNRYHYWLFGQDTSGGLIRGDFGISYIKKEPVSAIIKDKMIWSLFFSVLSIVLAYLVSIPIGARLARKPDSRISKFTQWLLFLLYAMPSFFVGVLLLMLFANPDVISLFPPSGIKPIGGYDEQASLFGKLRDSLPYVVLPLICYTYSSLAYISRLTQTSLSEQLKLDYIKTARAKGLNDKAVIWKHALKNSLLPLITVFSAVFPSIIGGSVIIESIFTIPGMGLETVKAILSKDYPVVIAIITLSCILTMLSYLLADLLYAWADPRIRYKP